MVKALVIDSILPGRLINAIHETDNASKVNVVKPFLFWKGNQKAVEIQRETSPPWVVSHFKARVEPKCCKYVMENHTPTTRSQVKSIFVVMPYYIISIVPNSS